MRLVFHHEGKYTGSRFTIEEVIRSLAAQRDLLVAGVMALPEIDPEIRIETVAILVEKLETSSLIWDLIVELNANYQGQIHDAIIGGIEGMFGVDIPEQYEALVSLLALAVTYMVARYAYERVIRSGSDKDPQVRIEGEGNVVIQNIAQVVNQSPETVEKALERAIPPAKRRTLISKVADFIRPARKAKGEIIEIRGAPPISSEALQEFPSDAELAAVDDSSNLDVEGALVEIRATDRDRSKVGWSAIIANDPRFPKRLPMDLYPTVNGEELAAHHFVRANLVVECERLPDQTLRPKRIHLLSYDPT